ncbi:MAG: 3-oxoacyl-ACP synthase III family protein [Proteobacteria bacterium]|nr:3-oxoacyl-ACP synthase III family protein [Pseudomonadota bacterium]
MQTGILGLSLWLPERIRDNSEWPEDFAEILRQRATDRTLTTVSTGAGSGDRYSRIVARHLANEVGDPFLNAKRRRVASDDLTSWSAECRAARAALHDAGIAARDIDVVMSWAVVPDRSPAPPSATRVAYEIGAVDASAVGVEAGCASAVAQMEFAAALIESGRARLVLLTQSHLILRTVSMRDAVSPILGDAATAMVLGPSEEHRIMATHVVSHGEYYDAVTWVRRGEDSPWYRAGSGFHLSSADRASARVLIQNSVGLGVQTVREVLDKTTCQADDIDVLACTQPRRWMPEAVAEGLGLSPHTAPQTFDEIGHVGGCSAVANLVEARQRGLLAPGSLIAMYTQGVGFTRASALIRW